MDVRMSSKRDYTVGIIPDGVIHAERLEDAVLHESEKWLAGDTLNNRTDKIPAIG